MLILISSCSGKQQNLQQQNVLQQNTLTEKQVSIHQIEMPNNVIYLKDTKENILVLEGKSKLDWTISDVQCIRNLSNDTLKKDTITIPYFFNDMAVLDSSYFILTSDIHTMGKQTQDYLHKYNKNWKLLWSKKMNHGKYPISKSFVYENKGENSLLYITNKSRLRSGKNKYDIIVKKLSLDGEMLIEKIFEGNDFLFPNKLTYLKDNSFLLTADASSLSNRRYKSWIANIDSNADVIWIDTLNAFYAKKTIQLNNSDILFFGEQGYDEKVWVIKRDHKNNILWKKRINTSIACDAIELEKGNAIFLSLKQIDSSEKYKPYIIELGGDGNLVADATIDNIISKKSNPLFIKKDGKVNIVFQSVKDHSENKINLINLEDIKLLKLDK